MPTSLANAAPELADTARDEVRLLADAESALVRYALERHGHLGPGVEPTLRYAFALARVSTTSPRAHGLDSFRRTVLGAAHALFGHAVQRSDPARPSAPVIASTARRLWPMTLAARDLDHRARHWDALLRRRGLALALGGGGGVGHVYLGCLALLEEWGLRPDLIAGTSFGAVMGLFRARQLAHHPQQLATILRALSFRKLFRLSRMRTQYSLPATLRLYLRAAMEPLIRPRGQPPVKLSDLSIPVVVAVAGIRNGMLPRPPKEYETLLDPRSFFPPTPRVLQHRVQDLLSVIGEFVRQPNRLDALYVGSDPGTEDFDALDAIGFSCSLPGFVHYDVLRDEPGAHAQIRALLAQREVSWLADGGLVENCPARAAHLGLARRQSSGGVENNVFVLALDAFSPKIRTPAWLALEQLAHETVRRVSGHADLYVSFPRTLSPLNVVPRLAQAHRAEHWGRAQLMPHMPLLARLLLPLPPLEASCPA
jgi:predicted acylesterase/phospholipase RssA